MKNVAEAVIKNNITFRQLRQKKSKNIPLMKGVLQNLTLIRQHELIQITFHYFRWTQTTYPCKESPFIPGSYQLWIRAWWLMTNHDQQFMTFLSATCQCAYKLKCMCTPQMQPLHVMLCVLYITFCFLINTNS